MKLRNLCLGRQQLILYDVYDYSHINSYLTGYSSAIRLEWCIHELDLKKVFYMDTLTRPDLCINHLGSRMPFFLTMFVA